VGERHDEELAPEWRGYQRLGAAVIVSAVRDLETPTRVGGKAVRERESAQAFLTVPNSILTFWCRVADFDTNAILRKFGRGRPAVPVAGSVDRML
jgi:hypothetical protein